MRDAMRDAMDDVRESWVDTNSLALHRAGHRHRGPCQHLRALRWQRHEAWMQLRMSQGCVLDHDRPRCEHLLQRRLCRRLRCQLRCRLRRRLRCRLRYGLHYLPSYRLHVQGVTARQTGWCKVLK